MLFRTVSYVAYIRFDLGLTAPNLAHPTLTDLMTLQNVPNVTKHIKGDVVNNLEGGRRWLSCSLGELVEREAIDLG